MERSAILAGFGGQGVLLLGKLIAMAAMNEGAEVSWLPSYGPEMRGGTANCTVVIADRPIGSPVVPTPDIAVVMNIPSSEKFGPLVRPGGLLLVNSTLVPDSKIPERPDVAIVRIPASGIAVDLGAPIVANMVMLGAFAFLTRTVALAGVARELAHLFGGKAQVLRLNRMAVATGVRVARTAGRPAEVVRA
ncbi:MAG: 2-oxoacid:acceptor oxidoreductase family protein [Planctomycetes bacterium]|nr:2-oxoacid:acceptor oxidoreductase family protein [Planctomycetota bacterium]